LAGVSGISVLTGNAGDAALLLVLAGLVLPCNLVKMLFSGNPGRGYNIHSFYLSTLRKLLQNTCNFVETRSAILVHSLLLKFWINKS
jgi:hypothetical protein